MRETNDGFIIAEKDLALRGPGEVLGTRQTGVMLFKVADLERDEALLPAVKECCQQLVAHYPEVCEALLMRWIGTKEQFGMV